MVKEKKSNGERLFDTDGYKMRAACVCVKNENENEVLLVSSSRNKNCWIIPGGGIEEKENPEDAAVREVYEEAGVRGRLGRSLGIFENSERKHRTNVYIMVVDKELDNWDEKEKRFRKWFNLTDAKSELDLHKPAQGSYLRLLKGFDSIYFTSNNHSPLLSTNMNNLNGQIFHHGLKNNPFSHNKHMLLNNSVSSMEMTTSSTMVANNNSSTKKNSLVNLCHTTLSLSSSLSQSSTVSTSTNNNANSTNLRAAATISN